MLVIPWGVLSYVFKGGIILNVGIRGLGTYIPESVMTAEDLARKTELPLEVIVEKMGITKKPIPGPEDHCTTMALKAAHKALEMAETDPEHIDVVIWTGDEYKDYPVWTAGIKVKEELGAKKAFAFDISLRCGTNILGFKVAMSFILSDPGIKRVLLLGGYRNGDLIDYKNPRVRFMYSLGAGGSAVLLQGDMEENLLLGSAFVDDGSLSETVYVPAGGTREPLTPEIIAKKRHMLDIKDHDFMRQRLGEVSMDNFLWVIETALKRSQLAIKDIDYIALLHMKPSAFFHVLSALNLTEDQTIYLHEYGHLGQNDQILSLELALERGLVKRGSIVVMVSAGVGYAWNAQVLRWG